MRKFIKKFVILAIGVSIVFSFTGCTYGSSTAEDQQTQQTDSELAQINQEVGMPNITNFTEKKLMKQIYELRDQSNLICYAYSKNMDGKYTYLGECQGYGLPYSTEYTNPEKEIDNGTDGVATIQQADPNGLYMPSSANATWLVMIDEKTGKQEVRYEESDVTVQESKLPARLCESWSLPANY